MIHRHALPREVQIGLAETLTLDIYSDAGSAQTATSGTVTVTINGITVVDAASVTVGGTVTSSYALSALSATTYSPTDEYMETWSVVISGTTYKFQRSGFLVRTKWYPTITDTDLTDLHADLLSLIPSGQTLQQYRDRAAGKIQRLLISKGRRPWLIFDPWMLVDPHTALSLHYFFVDASSSAGSDSRYAELAEEYGKQFEREFAAVNFRYDVDETGLLPDGETTASIGAIHLTAGPSRLVTWRR